MEFTSISVEIKGKFFPPLGSHSEGEGKQNPETSMNARFGVVGRKLAPPSCASSEGGNGGCDGRMLAPPSCVLSEEGAGGCAERKWAPSVLCFKRGRG